jgi:hypothetical protein
MFVNFSFKREPYRVNILTVFRDFNIKNLNLMEFNKKALTVPLCAFILKSNKPINMRYASSF